MTKHSARPGRYAFIQMMKRYGMDQELADVLWWTDSR